MPRLCHRFKTLIESVVPLRYVRYQVQTEGGIDGLVNPSLADEADAEMASIIRRHGWFIPYVGGEFCSRPGCDCVPSDDPPFAYTVGLFGLGHPELLIFGVDLETARRVMNDLGDRVRQDEALLPGHMIVFEDWPPDPPRGGTQSG